MNAWRGARRHTSPPLPIPPPKPPLVQHNMRPAIGAPARSSPHFNRAMCLQGSSHRSARRNTPTPAQVRTCCSGHSNRKHENECTRNKNGGLQSVAALCATSSRCEMRPSVRPAFKMRHIRGRCKVSSTLLMHQPCSVYPELGTLQRSHAAGEGAARRLELHAGRRVYRHRGQ